MEFDELDIFLKRNTEYKPFEDEPPLLRAEPIGVPGAYSPLQMYPKHAPSRSPSPSPLKLREKEKSEINAGDTLAEFGLANVSVSEQDLMQLVSELGLGGDDATDLVKGLAGSSTADLTETNASPVAKEAEKPAATPAPKAQPKEVEEPKATKRVSDVKSDDVVVPRISFGDAERALQAELKTRVEERKSTRPTSGEKKPAAKEQPNKAEETQADKPAAEVVPAPTAKPAVEAVPAPATQPPVEVAPPSAAKRDDEAKPQSKSETAEEQLEELVEEAKAGASVEGPVPEVKKADEVTSYSAVAPEAKPDRLHGRKERAEAAEDHQAATPVRNQQPTPISAPASPWQEDPPKE